MSLYPINDSTLIREKRTHTILLATNTTEVGGTIKFHELSGSVVCEPEFPLSCSGALVAADVMDDAIDSQPNIAQWTVVAVDGDICWREHANTDMDRWMEEDR